MLPPDKALANQLLEVIRTQGTPLVRIHTGDIEGMREERPGAVHANAYVEGWESQEGNKADPDVSPSDLERDFVSLAEWAHPLSWAHTQDDAEAWELQRRIVMKRAQDGDARAEAILPHLMTTDSFNAFGWYGKWYHYGCQSIDIEEEYAASLCATKIAPSELEYVSLPWPIFVVRVPRFLQHLRVNGEPLKLIIANHVRYSGAVRVTGKQQIDGATTKLERYSLHLITANKYRILPAQSLAHWAEPVLGGSYDEFRLVETELGEVDRRQIEIIGRLVLGAVISMSNPKAHRAYGRLMAGKKPSIGSPRYGTADAVMLHKIGSPVRVDAREVVSAYVTGQRGKVTNVRTLVAGHWKNQPHGPKRSLRRWQHIECYWRGDDDAPTIIRPHVLTQPDATTKTE